MKPARRAQITTVATMTTMRDQQNGKTNKAIPLILENEGRYEVSEEATKLLDDLPAPLAVVSIAGLWRRSVDLRGMTFRSSTAPRWRRQPRVPVNHLGASSPRRSPHTSPRFLKSREWPCWSCRSAGRASSSSLCRERAPRSFKAASTALQAALFGCVSTS